MNTRISSAVSTVALMGCTICHVWTGIQLLRVLTAPERGMDSAGPSLSLVLFYMAAVCVFNWFALDSGSVAYRRAAVGATMLHLVGALLQGAAAQVVVQESDSWLQSAVAIVAVVNLPMNGVDVISRADSLIPWGTAMFFALNLAAVVLRLRRMPVYNG